MEKGREEGKLETARNALAKGLPIDVVSDITGLNSEVLRNLSVN
jgi:predicted transposase YdaD